MHKRQKPPPTANASVNNTLARKTVSRPNAKRIQREASRVLTTSHPFELPEFIGPFNFRKRGSHKQRQLQITLSSNHPVCKQPCQGTTMPSKYKTARNASPMTPVGVSPTQLKIKGANKANDAKTKSQSTHWSVIKCKAARVNHAWGEQ